MALSSGKNFSDNAHFLQTCNRRRGVLLVCQDRSLRSGASFLADRTYIGRAYATVLRLSLSVIVCDVMRCG